MTFKGCAKGIVVRDWRKLDLGTGGGGSAGSSAKVDAAASPRDVCFLRGLLLMLLLRLIAETVGRAGGSLEGDTGVARWW